MAVLATGLLKHRDHDVDVLRPPVHCQPHPQPQLQLDGLDRHRLHLARVQAAAIGGIVKASAQKIWQEELRWRRIEDLLAIPPNAAIHRLHNQGVALEKSPADCERAHCSPAVAPRGGQVPALDADLLAPYDPKVPGAEHVDDSFAVRDGRSTAVENSYMRLPPDDAGTLHPELRHALCHAIHPIVLVRLHGWPHAPRPDARRFEVH
mmetsp:Transcript_58289/g.147809  ORF Transcript_58289/g.147809 Transcript_58289/m.147809 type:complete len:207 (+) Transcript_58289:233-853(+)